MNRSSTFSICALFALLLFPSVVEARHITVGDIKGGTIRVIDLHGKLVQTLSLQAGAAAFSTVSMPNGMYIVLHVDAYGKTSASQKLVVQH